MNAVSLNIAILPDKAVQAHAIELSSQAADQLPTEFVLNTTNVFPHITVYQAHFPTKNIEKIKSELKEYVQNLKPLTISMNNFTVSYKTFVFWNCVKTDELYALQKGIIEKVNDLREGLILPHLSNVEGISADDEKDITEYGSLLIGPRYTPHITITRLKNSNDATKATNILGEKDPQTFSAGSIVLGYLAPHGTVNGIIETYGVGG